MNEEEKEFVEDTEKEIEKEQETINAVNDEITEESNKEGLVLNDIEQEFHVHGMMESTSTYSGEIIADTMECINSFSVGDVNVKRTLMSESQAQKNAPPLIYYTGEKVDISFVVTPIDKHGNNGKKWLTKEEYERIKKSKNE